MSRVFPWTVFPSGRGGASEETNNKARQTIARMLKRVSDVDDAETLFVSDAHPFKRIPAASQNVPRKCCIISDRWLSLVLAGANSIVRPYLGARGTIQANRGEAQQCL